MTCPVCGGVTRVILSDTDCEAVYRQRKCMACKQSFYTTEIETKTSESDLKSLRSKHWVENRRKRKEIFEEARE